MSDEQPTLEITEIRDGVRVRVRLRGELDLATAPRLSEALRTLHDRREPILIDLDELSFIDMSGLRVVMTAAARASREGGALSVTPGSPQVRRLLALVPLDANLPLDGSSR